MNKKIVTAVGSAIVGLAVAHTGQEAQASDSQELIVKSENKSNITAEALNTKKQEYSASKSQVSKSEQRIASLNKEISSTDSKISAVNTKISDVKNNMSQETQASAKSNLEKLNSQKSNVEKEIADKSKTLESTKVMQDVTQSKSEKLQKEVDSAKANKVSVENKIKSISDRTEHISASKSRVDELSNKVTDLEKTVDAKKKDLVQDEKNFKAENDSRNELINRQNSEKSELGKAQKDLTSAETAKKNASAASKSIFEESKIATTISLDSRFVSALKTYLSNQTSTNLQNVINIEKQLKMTQPPFSSGKQYAEGDTKVDPLNLSEHHKELLSQYFILLNNQIRAQFGKAPQHLNLNAQKFVNMITDQTQKDNFRPYEHYHRAINKAAYAIGIDKTDKGTVYNRFESLDFYGGVDRKATTMKDLYDQIFMSVQRFYYEGQMNNHYLHAAHLLSDADVTAVGYAFVPNTSRRSSEVRFYNPRFSVVSINKLFMHDGWRYVGNQYVANYDRYEALFGNSSGKNVTPLTPNKVTISSVDQYAIKVAEAKIADAKQRIAKSNEKIAELERQIKSIKVTDIDAKRQIVREKELELKNLKTELSQTKEYLSKQMKLSAEDKLNLDKLSSENASAAKVLEEKIKAHSESLKELQSIKEKINGLENEIKSLQKTVEKLNDEIKDEQAKILNAKDSETSLKQLNELKSQLELEKKNLESQISEANEIKKKFDSETLELLVELETMQIKYDQGTRYFATTQFAPVHEVPEFDINTLAKEDDKTNDLTLQPGDKLSKSELKDDKFSKIEKVVDTQSNKKTDAIDKDQKSSKDQKSQDQSKSLVKKDSSDRKVSQKSSNQQELQKSHSEIKKLPNTAENSAETSIIGAIVMLTGLASLRKRI